MYESAIGPSSSVRQSSDGFCSDVTSWKGHVIRPAEVDHELLSVTVPILVREKNWRSLSLPLTCVIYLSVRYVFQCDKVTTFARSKYVFGHVYLRVGSHVVSG